MPINVTDAERELEQARAALEKVQSDLQILIARQTELNALVSSWQTIVTAKRREIGDGTMLIPTPHSSAEVRAADPDPASFLNVDAANGLGFSEDEEEAGNKTQFVRDQVQSHASTGISVADLKKAAANVGLSHPASWPYGSLNRLKKRGEVIKRRGRFYPSNGSRDGIALAG